VATNAQRSEPLTRPHRPLLYRPFFGLGGGLVLLAVTGLFILGVGPQTDRIAPATAFAPIGELDQVTYDAVQQVRNPVLGFLARVLNFLGSGVFSIPFRVVALLVLLLVLRRFRHGIAFAATWIVSEALLTLLKITIDRGRPPDPLVPTVGTSFPSGHSVAGAAIGISLVIAFLPAGHRRRVWEWTAAGFAFLMGLSRVYLNAHWLSDAATGVCLGAGVALTVAAIVALLDTRIEGHVPVDEIDRDDVSEAEPA
jgi:undecaprenyl-diphosphatase